MPTDAKKLYNIEDLRLAAKRNLPRGIFEFVDGGAEDGIAVEHNREALNQLKFKNRVLIDVSKRSTATEIFGRQMALPLGVAPTGGAGIVWYEGEIGIAKAAARMGVPCSTATNALIPMEEIQERAGGNLWFQLYMWSDKELSIKFLNRVKAAGYEVLVITVDGPVGPNREYNLRNGFTNPLRYSPGMIAQILARPGWCLNTLARQYLHRGAFAKENYPEELGRKLTDEGPN
ncbi:MAG: alpha-hydroxy acid oxidase, partial [Rhodospirillaceae bacterium]